MITFIGGIFFVAGIILTGSTCDGNTQQLFIAAIGLVFFGLGTTLIIRGEDK
jgi:hypothetical protein